RRMFVEPSRIPAGFTQITDAVVAAPAISSGGSVAGIPEGVYSGAQTDQGERYAPPPEAPAKRQPVAADRAIPVRLGGKVLEAKIIRRVIPEYPALARSMRVSGRVSLTSIIGRDGTVRDLKLVAGHPLLANAALAAVRQWVYSPTLLNGEPVEVMAPIEVNFTLAQ
ncbi:MAG: energy transducer TonB, partial [Bryobacteraceae bacterium]|nr:energy transducer TonB [Bryobacteraceae bacterium]